MNVTVSTKAPSLGALLSLAWPIVLSRSSQVVVGVCDAAMVAHLGEAALAATTTGALNTFNVMILPLGIVFIVSTYSSQLVGRGDAVGARRFGFYGLGIALAAQLFCLAAIPVIPSALGLLDYAPNVRDPMVSYLEVRLLSAGASVGLEALANYYGGLGNTRLPMFASVAAMLLNVVGNYLLIDGNLGAPAMGVTGAALASTLSTSVAFLGLLVWFLFDRPAGSRVVAPGLSWRELGTMLRFGLPSGFNWFFEFLAFSFFVNVVVAGLGTTSLAAMMAVMQLSSVSFMPAFGLASAGAVLVGQALGAKRYDDVPKIVRTTAIVNCVWQGAVGLAYATMPRLLLSPFADNSVDTTAFMTIGARMLTLGACWQLFDAVATTLAEALRAAGDTAFTLWMRLIIAWAVFVPGVTLTVRHFGGGDTGAIVWLVVYLGLLAVALLLRFRANAWRKIDITAQQQAA